MPLKLSSLLLAALFAACGVSVEQSSPSSDLSVSEADTQAAETAPEASTDLDFELTDTEGKTHKLSSYLADGKTVVLEWFNPGCPVVRKYHEGDSAMKSYATAALADDDVVWLAINSGADGKQGHGRDVNQDARIKWALDYPVLLDESGDVGRMFGAQTTPHMFVITPQDGVVYQGGIDESENRGPPLPTSLVSRALAELEAGAPVSVPKVKPFGCSVKYAH
ncbi:MAG: thioredoxin family protein [Planctomycetota bacterium]|nr:MAG: thioredoxin family protein [Planctomycetota bacterium]